MGIRNAASKPDAEAALRRVWAETYDPTAPEARPLQRYLARRGIDAEPDPRIIRFHPGLGYWEKEGETWARRGTYPALVARVADAEGKPVSLHRIFLTPEGDKAPVPCPKKMMPPLAPVVGGAIRLYPAGSTLAITEGIETALVIRQRTMMPIWAGVSATLMERFQPPPGVEALVVWGDLDRTGRGEEAACKLQNRMVAQGIRSCVHLPTAPIPDHAKGVDWADLWRLKDLAVL